MVRHEGIILGIISIIMGIRDAIIFCLLSEVGSAKNFSIISSMKFRIINFFNFKKIKFRFELYV